ncbi:hypothetical protein TNCV_3191921 [Trichonephila clavipes]|nr:hypothetical protein TNCV_3191921 [Trichonephila clavipes]
MPSPAFRRSYIQSVLGLCQKGKSSDERRRKSVTPNEGVAEDIYQALLKRNQRHSKFYQMVQLYRRYEAEESWSTEI